MKREVPSGGASTATHKHPNFSGNNSPDRRVRPVADIPSPTLESDEGETQGRGHFFGLHFPTFLEACKLGMNHAVSYLILARGTQADNRTTTWSTNAVEKKSLISRPKAKECISDLTERKLVEHVGGTKHRPVRALFAPPEPAFGNRAGEILDSEGEAIMRKMPLAVKGQTKRLTAKLEQLATDGWITKGADYWQPTKDVMLIRAKADLTWLPNSLVDGISGQNSPVELLRQTQDVWTLCLLISLYKHHELTFSQGISHDTLLETYTRKKTGEFREFDMFEFCRDGPRVVADSDLVRNFEESPSERDALSQFFEAIDLLKRLGLVTFVPHLLDGPEGEILFPLVEPQKGADVTEAEGKLFEAVDAAATSLERMKGYPTAKRAANSPIKVLVQNHIGKAQVRGIARMRHRPRTMVTAEWMAQSERWDQWTSLYERLDRDIRLAKVLAE